MAELKTIRYRGGLVTFRIPASWREEYKPEGGGTFFADKPDSGTLRLNVLTLKSEGQITQDALLDALKDRRPDKTVVILPNGNAMTRYIKTGEEAGEQLLFHYWEVANPVPPQHMRLAIFSYTVLARIGSSPAVAAELELLERCITESEFASVLGVTPSVKPKPWWKLW